MRLLSKEQEKSSKLKRADGEVSLLESVQGRRMTAERGLEEFKLSAVRQKQTIADDLAHFAKECELKRKEISMPGVDIVAVSLEPITRMREFAQDSLRESESTKTKVSIREKDVLKREQSVAERERGIVERERTVQNRVQELKTRESVQAPKEEALRKSELDLERKQDEYNSFVKRQNNALEAQAGQLSESFKAVEELMESMKKKEALLAKDRIAIEDGYANLRKAKREILGRED